MSKQIIFNENARMALKKGINNVADAVRITLGPRGRNVVLDKGFGAPTITNDGVTIAKEIDLKDKFENMGAEIIKEVAQKTNDNAGDGTTTAVVLTHAIVNEGLKKTSMGVNAMGIRHGIDAAAHEVVEALRGSAKPIQSKEEIMQVASISAESEEIGKIIADTIGKVGKDGVVTVEESQSFGIESEVVEGMEFDKGYVSPYMITNGERMEAEFKDSHILITDKKISSIQEILPLLEKLAQGGKKDLVIIADDVEGEALATFVVNKLRGTFNVLAVKAPGYGDRKKEILEDIAITVGGKVISEETGTKFENAEVAMLGRARRVVATKDNTVLIGGKGKRADIENRVAQLRRQAEMTESKFDLEKIEERIAKLSGGVAVIRVGAATETEMKYMKLKIEDSVAATKAAIEEGVVPGGGSALVKAAQKVAGKNMKSPLKNFEDEFEVGFSLVLKAAEAPLKQIAVNAGKDDGSVIVAEVKKRRGNTGYDAAADEIISDMLAEGIIDPVKVARSALQNAASAAAILLTTDVAIADEPKEEKDAPMPDMGGMGGGMPGMM
ncbi:chaperonin GroEL [bacterium]|nr:chaperonin GroEL [bacterium]|tara:strand:- start:7344 stop:9008 length:1665 start_codon:yes stop_codon:yes gene_type:complete